MTINQFLIRYVPGHTPQTAPGAIPDPTRVVAFCDALALHRANLGLPLVEQDHLAQLQLQFFPEQRELCEMYGRFLLRFPAIAQQVGITAVDLNPVVQMDDALEKLNDTAKDLLLVATDTGLLVNATLGQTNEHVLAQVNLMIADPSDPLHTVAKVQFQSCNNQRLRDQTIKERPAKARVRARVRADKKLRQVMAAAQRRRNLDRFRQAALAGETHLIKDPKEE